MKPMLASKVDLAKLKYPCLVSPKLDGIRCVIRWRTPLSRKLIKIPNRHIQNIIGSRGNLHGFDGELIVGEAAGEGVFARTTSAVMSIEGKPNFKFHVFDSFLHPALAFEYRYQTDIKNKAKKWPSWIEIVPQYEAVSEAHLRGFHRLFIEAGYEGTMIRSPHGIYKFGRSTTNEGILLKMVDYATEEAIVVDFEEQQRNDNALVSDNLGHAKRSSAKAGLRGKNTLGALVVESRLYTDVFRIGTGFTDTQRNSIWTNKKKYKGALVKFKHKPFGQKDAPRHPVFLGFRDKIDL